MKTFSVILLMGMLAGSNLFKSADEDFSSKELTKASVITCATVDTVIVPATIRTSFDTKYPKATKVMWYQYTPDKTQTVDPTAWYYGLDDKDYYVTFYWDDADYIAWYDNGNWIRSSKTVDNIDLPADVMRSINTQYPGFRIADVDMEKDNNQELYEVKLAKIWTSPLFVPIQKLPSSSSIIDVTIALVNGGKLNSKGSGTNAMDGFFPERISKSFKPPVVQAHILFLESWKRE